MNGKLFSSKEDLFMGAVQDFKCNGCGAPLPIPKNSKGHVKCPSCKTECVIEGLVKNAEIAAKENINSGVPLSATPATLHRTLISLLSQSICAPLDVLDKVEVIREERYCVPAYCFYCNGTAAFTYEVGNERSQTYTVNRGDKVEVREQTRIEWSPSSSTAAISTTVFASGNRRLATKIEKLYANFDPNKLVDIEDLTFPADVETYNCDLPNLASFNEYVAPSIEKALMEKAVYTISNQNTRGLSMGGASIQKDTVRVFLGLYHVVFKYNNEEYSVWFTGDGEKAFSERLPEDIQRKNILSELLRKRESIQLKTGGLKFGMYACIIGALFTKGISLIGAIIFAVLRFKKKKEYQAKLDLAQKEINEFEAQSINAVKQFQMQKKALRGIYEEVTGDANAF